METSVSGGRGGRGRIHSSGTRIHRWKGGKRCFCFLGICRSRYRKGNGSNKYKKSRRRSAHRKRSLKT